MFEIVQESVKVCTTGMSSRTLYAQHPVSISPRFSPTFFYRGANPAPYSAPFFSTLQPKLMHLLCTAVLIGSMLKTLFEIVHEESVKVYHLHNVQREYSTELYA